MLLHLLTSDGNYRIHFCGLYCRYYPRDDANQNADDKRPSHVPYRNIHGKLKHTCEYDGKDYYEKQPDDATDDAKKRRFEKKFCENDTVFGANGFL